MGSQTEYPTADLTENLANYPADQIESMVDSNTKEMMILLI